MRGVAFSVALSAGEGGRRSASVELAVSSCVTFSPLPAATSKQQRPLCTSCFQVDLSAAAASQVSVLIDAQRLEVALVGVLVPQLQASGWMSSLAMDGHHV